MVDFSPFLEEPSTDEVAEEILFINLRDADEFVDGFPAGRQIQLFELPAALHTLQAPPGLVFGGVSIIFRCDEMDLLEEFVNAFEQLPTKIGLLMLSLDFENRFQPVSGRFQKLCFRLASIPVGYLGIDDFDASPWSEACLLRLMDGFSNRHQEDTNSTFKICLSDGSCHALNAVIAFCGEGRSEDGPTLP